MRLIDEVTGMSLVVDSLSQIIRARGAFAIMLHTIYI